MKKIMPLLFVGLGIFFLVASYILGQQMNEHWAVNKIVSMAMTVAGSFALLLGVVTYILVKENDQDVW